MKCPYTKYIYNVKNSSVPIVAYHIRKNPKLPKTATNVVTSACDGKFNIELNISNSGGCNFCSNYSELEIEFICTNCHNIEKPFYDLYTLQQFINHQFN